MKSLLKAILLVVTFIPITATALQLSDLYVMDDTARGWYLGGIYDANIVRWDDGGIRSNCLEELGFIGFTNKISEFIVSLPEDPNSNERKLYDQMNVATFSALIIDRECSDQTE